MNYKYVFSTILAISILLSVISCTTEKNTISVTTSPVSETNIVSETTEVTSHIETTEIPETTTEIGLLSSEKTLTAEESMEVFNYYTNGRTIVKLAYSEFETFLDDLPKDREIEEIVIEVADVPGLYLWVSNYSFSPDEYHVSFVFYNGDVEVNNLDFVFDDQRFVVLKTDELMAIGVTGTNTEYYIYNSDRYRHLGPNCGRDGSIIELFIEDGKMCYRMENPIITHGRNDSSIILENVISPQTWKEEWGTIDGNLNFCKAGESTIVDNGYLSSLLPYDNINNIQDIFARNNAKYDIDIPKINLLPEHINLPVYLANSDLTTPGFVSDTTCYNNEIYDYIRYIYSTTGFFHDKYIVAFPDYPELAFVFKTLVYIDNCNLPEIRSTMQYVYYNGYTLDSSEYSIGDFGFDMIYTDDIIAILGGVPCGEGPKLLLSKNGIYDSSIEKETGLNFNYRFSVTDNGIMNITMVPTEIAHAHSIDWCLNFESDNIYSISAVATVSENGVILTETARMTLGEFFESDLSSSMKGSSGASTFDEYKEYVKNWKP